MAPDGLIKAAHTGFPISASKWKIEHLRVI